MAVNAQHIHNPLKSIDNSGKISRISYESGSATHKSTCSPKSATGSIGRPSTPAYSEVARWFQSVDNKHEGKISAKELKLAFEVFQGKTFSDASCKFVVRLFDLDKNGGLDVKEFETLYFFVKQWVNAFNAYDQRRIGFLDESEFDGALKHMDIHFTPEFIKFLVQRADPVTRKISLDQFIVTCVQIQRYTDEFKVRDESYSGSIQLKYEDFLEMILRCV